MQAYKAKEKEDNNIIHVHISSNGLLIFYTEIVRTQHSGLFQKLIAGLKGHLLQRGAVGLNAEAVEGFVHAFKAHVISH